MNTVLAICGAVLLLLGWIAFTPMAASSDEKSRAWPLFVIGAVVIMAAIWK